MLKQLKIYPFYKKIKLVKGNNPIIKKDINSYYKQFKKENSTESSFFSKRANKLKINTKFNNKSLSQYNPRNELINTIKTFLTEPSNSFYSTNISNIKENLNQSKKTAKSRNNKNYSFIFKTENSNNSKKNKLNFSNNFLSKRNTITLDNYSNANKSIFENIYNKENNYNNNLDDYSNNFEIELEKRIKIIEELNINISNMKNKIELMEYEINLINNYFNQVNKQLIKVLCNSKTIKILQKNFDWEIPHIRKEIDKMRNKIYYLIKEKDIYNMHSYNTITDIEIMKEEENNIEYMNENIESEIKNIKKKIHLIQSLNTNFKKLLNKKIFY